MSAKPKRGRLKGGLALVAAVIAFFALDQFVLTRFYAPERHAARDACIGPYDASPAWQNTCEQTLNFRYCLLTATEEACANASLAPGEGISDVQSTINRLPDFSGMRRKACAAPFEPAQRPHPMNKRLRDVCVPEGEGD